VFFLFYGAGWMAVDLFFGLSGFIFFWLYAKGIAEGRVSAADFFVLRFSRLYPLHLVTLLAVGVEQWAFRRLTGHFFIYSWNDRYHLALNLPLASSWGLEHGFSFNGPIWSVSVEVALYLMFFVLCRTLRIRAIHLVALSAFGFIMVSSWYPQIGTGMGGFFLGGFTYLAYEEIVRREYDRVLARWLPFLVGLLWIGAATWVRLELRLHELPARYGHIADYWPVPVILFPLTILALALVETRRGTLGRRLSFLGNISYSSYLLHFPLQLAVAGIVTRFAIDPSLFASKRFLLTFFGVLTAMSLSSFYFFEAPARRWIRARLLTRRAALRQPPAGAPLGGG
jgi:peptidoglycan/LPS O-acetylase OafA/YrhL